MRKFLSLTLLLLMTAICTNAQDAAHWTYTAGQYDNETYVYADVIVDGTTLRSDVDYNAYEYAAFIGNELRAVAELEMLNPDEKVFGLVFRVEGSTEDIGKSITFKAWNKTKQREIDLQMVEEPLPTFTGETLDPGIPSNPRHLYLYEPVDVEEITSRFSNADMQDSWIHCSTGEDLTPYFIDGVAFAIAPANATNKEVRFEHSVPNLDMPAVYISDDGKSITAANYPMAEPIKVVSVSNPDVYCLVYVLVHNDFSTVTAKQAEYSFFYKGETLDLTETLGDAITFGPEGAQTIGGTPIVESSDPTVVEVNDNGIFGHKVGEATITTTIPVINYLNRTFYPEQTYQTTASASFKVTIAQGLTGLQVEWPETMATGQESTIVIKPLPEGAEFSSDGMFTVTDGIGDNVGEVIMADQIYAVVMPYVPGNITLNVNYDGLDGTVLTESKTMEVGYTFEMSNGWEWCTIPYVNFALEKNGLQDVFGDELVEIRTQSQQLYNDPSYGYFGSQDLIGQNVAFKLKMQMKEPADIISHVFYGGQTGVFTSAVTLRRGWNYLPNPYVVDVTPGNFFAETMVPVEGDRIVSKSRGFVEYTNGQWVGDLTQMRVGEGFLFYNAGEAGRTATFANQVNAVPAPTIDPNVQGSRQLASRHTTWQYDARRFRDNMTIVAQLSDLSGQYSIGAFVGDECRGEGRLVDGKYFITVHADGGEQISFKLLDEVTGELYDIDQTVRMQQMLGTVKQPFSMSTNMVVTGISTPYNSEFKILNYNFGGRRIDSAAKGIQLQRTSDGKVRKVVR